MLKNEEFLILVVVWSVANQLAENQSCTGTEYGNDYPSKKNEFLWKAVAGDLSTRNF